MKKKQLILNQDEIFLLEMLWVIASHFAVIDNCNKVITGWPFSKWFKNNQMSEYLVHLNQTYAII